MNWSHTVKTYYRPNRRHKYGAKKTTVNGIIFDSKKEAKRYGELLLLEKAGDIKDLELQPVFILQKGFTHKGKLVREIKYIADFKYYDRRAEAWVVEDVKGFRPAEYMIKKKIFLKLYGHIYEFNEVSV